MRLAEGMALRQGGDHAAACEALLALAHELPDDGEVWFQVAWAHDRAGRETEAVPLYENALAAPGLSADDRREALLGLGSTYRLLGRTRDAVRLLTAAVEEFPEHDALRVFLAMAHFDAGEHRAGFGCLLHVLVGTAAGDGTIAEYRRPLIEHAVAYEGDDRTC